MSLNDETVATAIAALRRERYELEHEYQRYEDSLSVAPLSVHIREKSEAVQKQRDAVDAAIADLEAERAQAGQAVMPTADWANAPTWANWWAMDESGEAFWYQNKPERGVSMWRCSEHGEEYELDAVPCPRWSTTLQPRPALVAPG